MSQHHVPFFDEGSRVGDSQVFVRTRQGQASPPNFGKANAVQISQLSGQVAFDAFVGGETVVERQFPFGTASGFFLHVRAIVEGEIRFSSSRKGSLGGSLATWIDARIGGNFHLIDETDEGGLARKAILVSATTTGDLTIHMRGRVNFPDWSIEVETDGVAIMAPGDGPAVLEDDTDDDGNRTIVIGDAKPTVTDD